MTERPIALRPELVGAYLCSNLIFMIRPSRLISRPAQGAGVKMWLTRIEPTDKPDYDQRTLECYRCEHSESMIVKFK